MYSTYRHVSYILLNEYIDGWCKYIYFNFRAYAMYKAEKKFTHVFGKSVKIHPAPTKVVYDFC